MKKIPCILLIDDDPTTNFLNQELINGLDITEKIHVAKNGKEALDYIKSSEKNYDLTQDICPIPSLIFLDIKMPLMGGYEFLDHYSKLPESQKENSVVVFLTASSAGDNEFHSKSNEFIYDFIEKPLKKEKLLELRDRYLSML